MLHHIRVTSEYGVVQNVPSVDVLDSDFTRMERMQSCVSRALLILSASKELTIGPLVHEHLEDLEVTRIGGVCQRRFCSGGSRLQTYT